MVAYQPWLKQHARIILPGNNQHKKIHTAPINVGHH